MNIKDISDKHQWEAFLTSQETYNFLQSWNWGELQQNTGETIWRKGLFEGDTLISICLIIKVDARRGRFIFCPNGPITNVAFDKKNGREIWNLWFKEFKKLGKDHGASFVRVSPLIAGTPENLKIFSRHKFKPAPLHMMHPEATWKLDISGTEEEIMKGMRKTTRNLVRRAERDGVIITQSDESKDLDTFYDIHMETVHRHHFVPFTEDFLRSQIEAFKWDDQIKIFLGYHEGKAISGGIFVFYGTKAYYHHGASLASKVPASYLVLWEAIREAKKRGCTTFNFWGFVDNPKHPWFGTTRFKQGFGGYKETYLHCQDLPLSKSYWIAWIIEKLRRWKRGY
jgi:peptidoglycan pentaglycine glycine transferase (the first glycine)